MTNNEVLNYKRGLDKLKEVIKKERLKIDKKFFYKILKDSEKVDSLQEKITEMVSYPEKYTEYQNKRNEKAKELSKDENGNPTLSKDEKGYTISTEKVAEFIAFQKELDAEYEDVLKEVKEDDKKLEDFLIQESDIKLSKFTINDIPEEISDFLEIFYPLLKE